MLAVTHFKLFCRDGGLKRGKVKDTFKEEQQKLYSKMLVGTQEDRSRSWRTCVEVDWLKNSLGRLLTEQGSQAGLTSSLSELPDWKIPSLMSKSTPFGFLGHCLSLACSVCVAVTGHSESAALLSEKARLKATCAQYRSIVFLGGSLLKENLYYYISLSSRLLFDSFNFLIFIWLLRLYHIVFLKLQTWFKPGM